jgi:hypothetical protein
MAIVFTNAGEAIALRNIVNNQPPQTLVIKLYSNNRTPTKLDTATDYTEVIGFGYSSQTLTTSSFTFVEGDPSTAAYPQITYSFTGAAGNVYGYYVVQQVSGTLMFANRFSNAPINIANNGDEIRITLTLQLNNPTI